MTLSTLHLSSSGSLSTILESPKKTKNSQLLIPWTQCAAVTTQVLERRAPPQKTDMSCLLLRFASQGWLLARARLPPTILESSLPKASHSPFIKGNSTTTRRIFIAVSFNHSRATEDFDLSQLKYEGLTLLLSHVANYIVNLINPYTCTNYHLSHVFILPSNG